MEYNTADGVDTNEYNNTNIEATFGPVSDEEKRKKRNQNLDRNSGRSAADGGPGG